MSRLCAALLDSVPTEVDRPAYDRASMRAAVVHLGAGAFHRAHQAVYFDQLMREGVADWMIAGSSLRSPAAADQLNPQDGLYTVQVRDSDSRKHRVIGSVANVIAATARPQALIDRLAKPETALVTLTVTEKGYATDPASGAPGPDAPSFAASVDSLDAPRTAPGFIAAGLRARRNAGLAPFTVLSCDNLPNNGARTGAAVLAIAGAHDPDLGGWIADHCAFPSSMVDRIVPATTGEDVDELAARLGYRDEAMVKTEPFTQWVVEDRFCARRPPLEQVGVQMTHDVAGWETAKLRLLNGAHSMLAYLGALAGHDFVHTAIAAPGYAEVVERLWDEAEATLPATDGFDARAYRRRLSERFRNAALQHRTRQIAIDGSQKLPQRLLGVIRDRRKRGAGAPTAVLAVAAWMRWQMGESDAGIVHAVEDPLASTTCAALAQGGDASADRVRALLAIEPVFGRDLREDEGLVRALSDAFDQLVCKGAAATVADLVRSPLQG